MATHWRGSCLENSMDGRGLVGFSPWVFVEPNMTEQFHFHFSIYRVTYCFSHARLYDPMDCSKLGLPVFISQSCSNSCPFSWDAIQSSYHHPISSCLQSFRTSGSFQINQLFASGGQSIEASASVFPTNIQGWFHLGLTRLISQSKGLSRVSYITYMWNLKKKKVSFFIKRKQSQTKLGERG